VSSYINSGVLHGPDGNSIKVLYPSGGYILERTVFDRVVQEEARISGARMLFNCRVIDICKSGTDRIKVKYTDSGGGEGVLVGRFIIGADGASSIVGRRMGLIKGFKRDLYVCFQYKAYIEGIDRDDEIYFFVNPELLPYSYAWIFPKGDNLYNVGVATLFRLLKLKPKEILDCWLRELKLEVDIVEYLSGVVPVGRRNIYDGSRVLLVGDAASLANPLTGEGICNAINSGRWAGEAVYNFLLSGRKSDVNRYYIDKVNRNMLKPNRRLYMIRNWFYNLSEKEVERIVVLLKKAIDNRHFREINIMSILYNLILKHPGGVIRSFWR